jgi:hypothetical protein
MLSATAQAVKINTAAGLLNPEEDPPRCLREALFPRQKRAKTLNEVT